MRKDFHLTKLIQLLLENRRFYVELNGKQSRWRKQRNGLPQGIVLAPVLFNIYTNDQPVSPGTRSFIYADDLGIAAQNHNIDDIEATLSTALQNLTKYYKDNQLKANPAKTHVSLFHLRNREVGRMLSLTWNGVYLKHCDFPVYLGVTLDRTLSYKQHIEKVKGKVRTRNNLLHKLTNSSWGANTFTLRATPLHSAILLQNMPVLCGKDHPMQRKLTPPLMTAADALPGACDQRMLTVYVLAGIAPPGVRRSVASRTERRRQADDTRHPCHNNQPAQSRLKSRKSFLHAVQPLSQPPQTARLALWEEQRIAKQHLANLPIPTSEQLAPGHKSEWKL